MTNTSLGRATGSIFLLAIASLVLARPASAQSTAYWPQEPKPKRYGLVLGGGLGVGYTDVIDVTRDPATGALTGGDGARPGVAWNLRLGWIASPITSISWENIFYYGKHEDTSGFLSVHTLAASYYLKDLYARFGIGLGRGDVEWKPDQFSSNSQSKVGLGYQISGGYEWLADEDLGLGLQLDVAFLNFDLGPHTTEPLMWASLVLQINWYASH